MILKDSFIVNFILYAIDHLFKFGKHYEEKATIGRLSLSEPRTTTPPISLHSGTCGAMRRSRAIRAGTMSFARHGTHVRGAAS